MSAIPPPAARRKLSYAELLNFARDSFNTHRVRFILTSLGMVIGTASLILVTTIGLTGKQYIVSQIQAIGANMIYAEYQGGAPRITAVPPDPLTLDDLDAVRAQVPDVTYASPLVVLDERISVPGGREKDLRVLGVAPAYKQVRNLIVVAGRFFDEDDSTARNKVGVITEKLAQQLYGSQDAAIGQTVKLSGLPFTIIGTFREGVETFGQSEVQDNSMAIPYSVSRIFTPDNAVKQIFFSVSDPTLVEPATEQIKRVFQARHRPESLYDVSNLTQLVSVANRTADALTVVLLLIALVVLLVSGIGIMNIMLATVSARIREIGIRKALGATQREIRFQFLSEAVLISVVGGIVGTVLGLAVPYSVRLFTTYRIPISGLSVFIALGVSSLVGIIFGTAPASRAARLDPVESLRYE